MRRHLALVLSALLVGLLGSGPAEATPLPQRLKVSDRAGDAAAGIDLLSGRYVLHSKPKKSFDFTAHVAQLTDTTFLAFEVHSLNAGWDRVTVYRERGRTVAKLYAIIDDDESNELDVDQRRCKALSYDWDAGADTVTVSVPMACLVVAGSASPGKYWMQVFSRFGGQRNGPGDALPEGKLDF